MALGLDALMLLPLDSAPKAPPLADLVLPVLPSVTGICFPCNLHMKGHRFIAHRSLDLPRCDHDVTPPSVKALSHSLARLVRRLKLPHFLRVTLRWQQHYIQFRDAPSPLQSESKNRNKSE